MFHSSSHVEAAAFFSIIIHSAKTKHLFYRIFLSIRIDSNRRVNEKRESDEEGSKVERKKNNVLPVLNEKRFSRFFWSILENGRKVSEWISCFGLLIT